MYCRTVSLPLGITTASAQSGSVPGARDDVVHRGRGLVVVRDHLEVAGLDGGDVPGVAGQEGALPVHVPDVVRRGELAGLGVGVPPQVVDRHLVDLGQVVHARPEVFRHVGDEDVEFGQALNRLLAWVMPGASAAPDRDADLSAAEVVADDPRKADADDQPPTAGRTRRASAATRICGSGSARPTRAAGSRP